MTSLSVNLNKIALLRNARGGDYPNLLEFAARFTELGADGLTIHPRPDERHIRAADVPELAEFVRQHPPLELNIEGYPSPDFLKMIEQIRPDQCTLVPDAPDQVTSDHGWTPEMMQKQLSDTAPRLSEAGARPVLFTDPDPAALEAASTLGFARVELYTGPYAAACAAGRQAQALDTYRHALDRAQALGLDVNAGHDLNLNNLAPLLALGEILEVSIGHALVVESLEQGMPAVVAAYRDICRSSG